MNKFLIIVAVSACLLAILGVYYFQVIQTHQEIVTITTKYPEIVSHIIP
jgi:hypothetical protein